MPLYEIMCIATLQSTPQQLVHSLQRLANVVQKGKGVFRRVENLGIRPLAYRMKAHMKYNTVGRYMRLYLQASPLLCRDVETRLRVDDNIVRTMTIKHQHEAPVVIEKKRKHKIPNLTSTTGILPHSPSVDYEAARVLLALNYLKAEDILSLPRWQPDASWESFRSDEILKRAHGGSAAAKAVLQLPVPTRQDDLALMKKLGDAEEEEMQAYESYRKARNARQVRDEEQYQADEEAALARRMEWYQRTGQQMRDAKIAKKLNDGRKVKSREQILALVKNFPMRWQRKGKKVQPPQWAINDMAKEAAAKADATPAPTTPSASPAAAAAAAQ